MGSLGFNTQKYINKALDGTAEGARIVSLGGGTLLAGATAKVIDASVGVYNTLTGNLYKNDAEDNTPLTKADFTKELQALEKRNEAKIITLQQALAA